MTDRIEGLTLDDLRIAEVGTEREVEITEAIRNLKVSLSATMVSQLTFDVFDPNFEMLKNNYFQIRRPMSYKGYKFEITAVNINRSGGAHDKVSVAARSEAIQKMSRAKGAKTWNSSDTKKISAAEVAFQEAKAFGLQTFIQQTPEKGSITRMQSEQTDESTWDVLRRLAADEEYMVFEAYGILYFTSEEYLLERQPFIKVNCSNSTNYTIESLNRPDENDPWYPYAFSMTANDNETAGSMATLKIGRENGMKLRPGMGIEFSNIGLFGARRHVITDVDWLEGSREPVTVKARTIIETKDTVADETKGRGIIPYGSRSLYMGVSDGNDIERLQDYLKHHGYFAGASSRTFDSNTEAAVKRWQTANKLGKEIRTEISDLDPNDRAFFGDKSTLTTYEVDGIINSDDWEVIMKPKDTSRRWIAWADVSLDEYTEAYRNAGSVETDSHAPVHDADRKFMQ
ncbi:MAG: hypothetical protein CMQ41_15630 [Gammaproteobacteria bacterium]|nr:hypothetical protein [Gammaproteobacteria bacterium]